MNPSGVAGKERILAELPTGVWSISETQLSGVSQKPAIHRIHGAGLEQHRNWHAVPGTAIPLRARSTHAGTWSGVLTLSELVTRNVQGHWDHGEFDLGRAQITQSFYGPFSVLGTNLYARPRSPTWPHSLRDTNLMFDNAIREIALSRGGPRLTAGDFNHPLTDLRRWEVLKRAGWKDAQELAHELWGQEPFMTFRDSTITDHTLLSPELTPFVTKVQGWNWFADHTALRVHLEVPAFKLTQSGHCPPRFHGKALIMRLGDNMIMQFPQVDTVLLKIG